MGSGARRWLGWMGTALLVVSFAAPLGDAQTLARRGWVGSGITVDSWWNGAVLYQIDPVSFQDSKGDGFGDLNGITQRLDYLGGLGVDAIVLSPFQLQPGFGHGTPGIPFDPKYGSEQDLDKLVQEASGRHLRIFVDLPMSSAHSTQELLGMARFWLSRGMTGLRLISDKGDALTAPQLAERLRELRKVCAAYAGQRVLLWDLPQPPPGAAVGRTYSRHAAGPAADGPQLAIDARLAAMPRFDTADLRQAMTLLPATGATPVPASDSTATARSFDRFGDGKHDVEIAKILAAALLTGPGAPLLYFGQEIGMATTPSQARAGDPTPMQWGAADHETTSFTSGVPWMDMGPNAATANVALEDADVASLLNWYRRLSALRHANPTLRNGAMEIVAETNPDVVAWVRRPNGPTGAPVVVVCNTTNRQLIVPVAGDLRRLGLESSGTMHTLASSTLLGPAKETGMVSVNGIALPPFGVYIGELPHQPGLEAAPSPIRSRYRSRTSP